MTHRRWVQRNGELIEVDLNTSYESSTATVLGDIQPYKSMVTGEMINSRSDHRNHLRDHKLIEIGNETRYLKPKPLSTAPGRKEMLIALADQKLRY